MSRFYVGQRVRLVGKWRGVTSDPSGSEAEIVMGPGAYIGRTTKEIYTWVVVTTDGKPIVANSCDLEPITDSYDKVEWSECLWRPTQEEQTA